MRQRRACLDDDDPNKGRSLYPALCLHGVVAGSEGRLDTRLPLDPPERPLPPATQPRQRSVRLECRPCVGGSEHGALSMAVLYARLARRRGMAKPGIEGLRRRRLVARVRCGTPIVLLRAAAPGARAVPGAHEAGAAGLVRPAQVGNVQDFAVVRTERSVSSVPAAGCLRVASLVVADVSAARDGAADVRRDMARPAQADIDRNGSAAPLLLGQPDRLGATRRPADTQPMLRRIVAILPGQRRVGRVRRAARDGRSTPRALRVRTRLRPAESDRARRRAMPPAHARHCVEAMQVNGALDVVRAVFCGLGTPARCAAAWEVFNGARTRVSCRAPNPAGITHGATPLRVSKSASRRGSDRDVRRQSIDSPAGGLRASGRF